ncbi:Max dimerization protein 1 [Larimichthys crocea]|uniref:Uncharacterized protein n=1 Tax=Larimichthys crocea TaxID=215358 RepID=A0ACD3Q8I6_LARCR|nr:Max dimerization protein 1 [Larimichthys crocea]
MAAIGLVQMLIEAAEYLERREREAEHGYASMPPFISSRERENLKRKSKSKKNTSSSALWKSYSDLAILVEQANGVFPRSPPCVVFQANAVDSVTPTSGLPAADDKPTAHPAAQNKHFYTHSEGESDVHTPTRSQAARTHSTEAGARGVCYVTVKWGGQVVANTHRTLATAETANLELRVG